MLQAELGEHGPRISGYRPGPMRTALRARAYQPNGDAEARAAADYAASCVALLSTAAAAQRGRRIVRPGLHGDQTQRVERVRVLRVQFQHLRKDAAG